MPEHVLSPVSVQGISQRGVKGTTSSYRIKCSVAHLNSCAKKALNSTTQHSNEICRIWVPCVIMDVALPKMVKEYKKKACASKNVAPALQSHLHPVCSFQTQGK
jgi:hypothetical protein